MEAGMATSGLVSFASIVLEVTLFIIQDLKQTAVITKKKVN
jgi:hypothetical protein